MKMLVIECVFLFPFLQGVARLLQLRRVLRREHHGHRRQDHPARETEPPLRAVRRRRPRPRPRHRRLQRGLGGLRRDGQEDDGPGQEGDAGNPDCFPENMFEF